MRCGNTPAYAGKTYFPNQITGKFRKHPRLRGEDTPTESVWQSIEETPPLTRGRLEL